MKINSHKVIKKIKGTSCVKLKPNFIHGFPSVTKNSSRDEAVDQAKAHAVRAGGNAIANIECEYDKLGSKCWGQVVCTADVIQVD